MEYTNKFGLPPEICNAIAKDRYTDNTEKPSDYSATTLINPIQQTILKRRYPGQGHIKDITEYSWSFFGSVCHSRIEEAWSEELGSKVEQRLYADVLGKVLSGKIDCYSNGQIKDWKFTKTYKIVKGDYKDWEAQLNIYAYLCRMNGYEVNQLTIYAFLRDWCAGNTYKKNYPQCEWAIIPLRLWSLEEQQQYINKRITGLKHANALGDSELADVFPCTNHEMWRDVKDYAIMKEGGKRAVKCFDTFEEAYQHLLDNYDNPKYTVEKRLTERTRCLHHCDCRDLCVQHNRLLKEEGREVEQTAIF